MPSSEPSDGPRCASLLDGKPFWPDPPHNPPCKTVTPPSYSGFETGPVLLGAMIWGMLLLKLTTLKTIFETEHYVPATSKICKQFFRLPKTSHESTLVYFQLSIFIARPPLQAWRGLSMTVVDRGCRFTPGLTLRPLSGPPPLGPPCQGPGGDNTPWSCGRAAPISETLCVSVVGHLKQNCPTEGGTTNNAWRPPADREVPSSSQAAVVNSDAREHDAHGPVDLRNVLRLIDRQWQNI